MDGYLIAVFGGIVFGGNDETAALASAAINSLDDVDELLLILESPVDLVVVAGAQIDHDVLVPEEEHNRRRIVQLVHGVEVRYFCDVNQIYHCKVLYRLCHRSQNLVHLRGRLTTRDSDRNSDESLLRCK